MGAAIGNILGNAVGVAISPVPVIAVILMLFTPRAKSNSLGFLVGWIVGLAVAGGLALALGLGGSDGDESGGWINVGIGALFILLGLRQWRGRPRGDEEPTMPTWMAKVDDFDLLKAVGLGFVLSAVNPKNLALTIAAAVSIESSGLTGGEEITTLAVFIAIASVTVAVPVVLNLAMGERAQPTLTEMKNWLIANNSTVMTVLFAVLGAKVLGEGLAGV